MATIATIQANLPEQLVKQMQSLVEQGWFADTDSLISDAVRRFLDSHTPELIEHFVREDIEWGLHGKE